MKPLPGWQERRLATSSLLHQVLALRAPYCQDRKCTGCRKYEVEKLAIVDRLIYHFSEAYGLGARSGRHKYLYVPLWSIEAFNEYCRLGLANLGEWPKNVFVLEHPVGRADLKRYLVLNSASYRNAEALQKDLNLYANVVVVTVAEDQKLGRSLGQKFRECPWKRYCGKVKLVDHDAIPSDLRETLPKRILQRLRTPDKSRLDSQT